MIMFFHRPALFFFMYQVSPHNPLCTVTKTDGSTFDLKCCIHGQIVEVNSRLVENPELLQLYPEQEGFLCIMLVKLESVPKVCIEKFSPSGKKGGMQSLFDLFIDE